MTILHFGGAIRDIIDIFSIFLSMGLEAMVN
jgi:hypothetical protein